VRALSDRDRLRVHEAIRRHYDSVWGVENVEEVHWTPGPLVQRLPNFHVVKVREVTDAQTWWILASIGAWEATLEQPESFEFVVATRFPNAVIENLAMLAYYHAGPPEQRMDVGHTVPIGSAWVAGSPLDHVLISRPYPWGPRLEHCPVGDRHVRVVWVLPIHESERAFAMANGLEALEKRFEEAGINYLDESRPAVI
jgi:hypothetical protein